MSYRTPCHTIPYLSHAIHYRVRVGMEAVVQTTSREEIEQAASAGGGGAISIISVVGKTVEEAAELQQYIPESVGVKWQLSRLTVYISFGPSRPLLALICCF